jgi:hypothetical protein
MNFGEKLLDQLRDFQFFKKDVSPLSLSVSQSDSDYMASVGTERTDLCAVAVVWFMFE